MTYRARLVGLMQNGEVGEGTALLTDETALRYDTEIPDETEAIRLARWARGEFCPECDVFSLEEGDQGGCTHTAGWRERCGVDSQGRLTGRSGRPLSPATIRSRDQRANPNSPAARRSARERARRDAQRIPDPNAPLVEEEKPEGERNAELGDQRLTTESTAATRESLKSRGYTGVRALAKTLTGDIPFDEARVFITARAAGEGTEFEDLRVNMTLKHATAFDADHGDLRFQVTLHGTEAHVGLMMSSGSYRTSAESMHMLGNMVKFAERHGVETVRTHAGLDMGGFAWARVGFEAKYPEYLADSVIGRIDNLERLSKGQSQSGLGSWYGRAADDGTKAASAWKSEHFASLREAVRANRSNPKLPRIMSEAKVDGKPVGRHLLRGSNWEAQLNMKDEAAVSRLKRFLR